MENAAKINQVVVDAYPDNTSFGLFKNNAEAPMADNTATGAGNGFNTNPTIAAK